MFNTTYYKLPAILIVSFLIASLIPAKVQCQTTSNAGFGTISQVVSMEITLNLLEADNSTRTADAALAEFNNNFCACVNMQDAAKFTNSNETFSFLRNGTSLAIERRPLILKNDTLFLRLTQSTKRNYQLVLKAKNLDQPMLLAFLEDKYTAITTTVSLVGITIVNFSINTDAASNNKDRFRLVFKQAGVLPVTYSDVKATQQGNNIAVKWNVENQLNIQRYEVEKSINGSKFTKVNTQTLTGTNAASGIYNWIDLDAVEGNNFYRIRNIDQDGASAYSKVVKVNIVKNSGGMSVYPNPVTGRAIGVKLTNMARGKYNIRLLTAPGQVLLNKEINHAGDSETEIISLSTNIPKGIYYLEITNPGMNKTAISVVNQ